MNLDNNFFKKVENKTKVNKDTIISLAQKLSNGNMKDENTLNEVIDTLCNMTGKSISSEKRQKIIDKVTKGNIPKNIDKMF